MNVVAIDPGTTHSQLIVWFDGLVVENRFLPNDEMLGSLVNVVDAERRIVIEMFQSFGMTVGKEVFETCVWIGRFYERCESFGVTPVLMYRQEVKLHLCNSARAKDANIRQALIDRFGGKDAAIGKKAKQGPLYGVSSHAWAALALAITFAERKP